MPVCSYFSIFYIECVIQVNHIVGFELPVPGCEVFQCQRCTTQFLAYSHHSVWDMWIKFMIV